MRILFTSLAFPFPASNGNRMRNSSLVRALAQEGHDVTLVAFTSDADRQHLPLAAPYCRTVIPVPLPSPGPARSLVTRFVSALRARPYGVLRFRSAAMQSALRDELAAQAYDAIFCDDIYMLGNLPPECPLPVLLNKHDLTFEIMQRYARFESNPLKRAYIAFEARNVRAWEIESCRRVRAILACSQRDLDILRGLCSKPGFAVVPNVIDVDAYAPVAESDGRTVLYVGAMDWLPNRDAVRYFVARILPELRRLSPGVRLVVAGRALPPDFQRELRAPDVVFTGEVADMRAQIATAAVSIVPLRIGSGTRLKIMEAAAMERPVVSTSIGAEGLNFVNGSEIEITDSPGEFARIAAALLSDPQRREAMGKAARVRVMQEYSIQALRRSLHHCLPEFIPCGNGGSVESPRHQAVS